jgi:hypothetical protein
MPLPNDLVPVGPVTTATSPLPPDLVAVPPATATPATGLPEDLMPVGAPAEDKSTGLLQGISSLLFGNDPGNATKLGPLTQTDGGDFYTDDKGELKALSTRDFIAKDPETGRLAVFEAHRDDSVLGKIRDLASALTVGMATNIPEGVALRGASKGAQAVEVAGQAARLPEDLVPLELTPAMEVKAAAEASAQTAAKLPEDLVQVTPPPKTAPQTAEELSADLNARGNNAYTISPERQAFLIENSSTAGKGAAKELQGVAPDLTEPIVKEPLSRDITGAIGELLTAGKVSLVPGIKVTDQVMDLLQTDLLDPEVFRSILKKYSLTPTEFLDKVTQGELGQSMRESARLSGRTLQQLSALSQLNTRLRALAGEQGAEISAFLAKEGLNDVGQNVRATSTRVGNLWRSSLVSQLSTSMRNAITAIGTAGIDTLARSFEVGLRDIFANPMRRLMGKDAVNDPIGAFANWINMAKAKRSYDVTKAVTDAYPKIKSGLFSSYASDVANVSGRTDMLGRLETVTNAINFHGKLQEYFFRRAFFTAELERRVGARGDNLYKMVAENRLADLHPEDMQAAVGEALRLTYGRPLGYSLFDRYMRAFNTVQSLGGKLPFPPFPFVRFMADAMKWQFEHSPFGPLVLLSKAERASLTAEKGLKVASRALAGSTMLYVGYMIRNSVFGGPNWYDIKIGDKTYDARPFAPLSSFLFVGDLIKRQQEGTLLGVDAKQLGQGLVGANFRAGSGLFLIDQLMAHLAGVDNERKLGEIAKGFAGETLAGFLTPFQQLRDAISIFDKEERIVRDTRSEPFLGPIKSRLPYVDRTSEPMAKPTRAGPTERQAPLLRMLTGINVAEPLNAAETELARLGFQRKEIIPPSGDIPYDIALTKKMGPLVEKVIGRIVESPNYQALSNKQKSFVLSRLLKAIRSSSLKQIKQEKPELAIRRMYERIPKRQRMMIEEMLKLRGSTLQPSELGE